MRSSLLFLTSWALFYLSPLFSIEAFYLTYPADPSSSIAVHWFEKEKDPSINTLCYREKQNLKWEEVPVESSSFGPYRLKRAQIYGLNPGSAYAFQIDREMDEYFFRTPSAQETLRVAFGGDVYRNKAVFFKTCQQVVAWKPDFVTLGGDIAYIKRSNAPFHWVQFFAAWQKAMITKERQVIPLISAVGNHDVMRKGRTEWYYHLFPYLENSSYGVVDIGDNVSIFLLDTGHLAAIRGKQSDWLAQALHKRVKRSWNIPVYHIAAYPSVYPFDQKTPSLIREFWCPFFETYGVRLAFENHNHAFKRTFPLIQGKQDSKGVTYIGDGAFGVSPRSPQKKRAYLAKSKASTCVSLVEITAETLHIQTVDDLGTVIDTAQLDR